MNLFEVLSNDQRMIVHSDETARMVYTWNGSKTLQAWRVGSSLKEDACQTLMETPINFNAARKAAIEWSQQ